MAKKKFGIPVGVSKALTDTMEMAHSEQSNFFATDILIEKIKLDSDNPRRHKISLEDLSNGPSNKDKDYKQKMAELESLIELSSSIQRDGLLNPITVIKDGDFFKIVAGERRFLATLLAKKTIIESRVFNREPNSFDLKVIQWSENESRKDLSLYNKLMNVLDILSAYKNKNSKDLTAIELSKTVSISRQLAQFYLGILSNSVLLEFVKDGKVDTLLLARSLINCRTKDEILNKINNKSQKKPAKEKSKGAGRRRTSVNFGGSKKTQVAKVLVGSVLDQEIFKKYSDDFSQTDWSCMNESTKAFQKLVKIMEKELGV